MKHLILCTITFLFWSNILKSQILVNEGFEGTFPPVGWAIQGNGINPSGARTWHRSLTNTAGQSGERAAQAYLIEAIPFNEFLFTPVFSFTAGDIIRVRAWFRKESFTRSNAFVRIHLASSQNRADTFSRLTEVTFSNNNYQFVEASFTYPTPIGSTPANACIGFQVQGQFSIGDLTVSLDDINIVKNPLCEGLPAKPIISGITNNNYAHTGFTLNRTGTAGPGLSYQWQRNTGSGWMNIAGQSGLSLAVVDQTITTQYRIRVFCSGTGEEDFSEPFTVTNPVPPVAPLPYFTSFESWTSQHSTRDVPLSSTSGNHALSIPSTGDRSARRQDDGLAGGWLNPTFGLDGRTAYFGSHAARIHTTRATAPAHLDFHLNGMGSIYKKLVFLESGGNEGDAVITQISLDEGQTFTDLPFSQPEETTSPDWIRKTYYFESNVPRLIVRLRVLPNNSLFNTTDVLIDSFSVSAIPTCTGLPTGYTLRKKSGEDFSCLAETTTMVCVGNQVKMEIQNPPLPVGGIRYWWVTRPNSSGTWSEIPGTENQPEITYPITASAQFSIIVQCQPARITSVPTQILTYQIAPEGSCPQNIFCDQATLLTHQATPTILPGSEVVFNNLYNIETTANLLSGCNWDVMKRSLWFKFVATNPIATLQLQNISIFSGSPTYANITVYEAGDMFECSNVFMGLSVICGNINISGLNATRNLYGLETGKTYIIRIGMDNCNEVFSADIALTTPSIAVSVPANTCTPTTTPLIIGSSTSYEWIGLLYNNEVIAEIHPRGNALGAVTASVYRNTADIRSTAAGPYLDRNISFTVETQPDPLVPVDVRIYISQEEFERLRDFPGSGISSLSDLRVTVNTDPCGSTFGNAGTVLPVTTGSIGENYYIEFSMNHFSSIFIHNKDVILPVTLLHFEMQGDKAYTNAKWKTQNESQLKEYALQWSATGNEFITIAKQKANNYSGVQNYSLQVERPSTSTTYWRLQMENKDGSFHYSKTIVLKGNEGRLLNIYPVPAKSEIFVPLTGAGNGKPQTAILFDMTGRVVRTVNLSPGSAFAKVNIEMLTPGMYQLRVIHGNEFEIYRVVKE